METFGVFLLSKKTFCFFVVDITAIERSLKMVLVVFACFFQSLLSQPTQVTASANTDFSDRIKPRLVRLVRSIEEMYSLPEANCDYRPSETVTQREHALQTADLAKAELGSEHSLVVTALLHDIGQVLTNSFHSDNDEMAYHFVKSIWGNEIALPIRLSTTAKRFLAAVDASYVAKLTHAKQSSLTHQGGAFAQDSQDYHQFRKHPAFSDSIAIRRWDDQANISGKPSSTFSDYAALLVEKAYSYLRANYTDHEIDKVIEIISQAHDLTRSRNH